MGQEERWYELEQRSVLIVLVLVFLLPSSSPRSASPTTGDEGGMSICRETIFKPSLFVVEVEFYVRLVVLEHFERGRAERIHCSLT